MTDLSIMAHYDRLAPRRSDWFRRNYLYHSQIIEACKPFVDPDSRVLELGCSTGNLLDRLNPKQGVGVDISPVSIDLARQRYPRYQWLCADVEKLPASAPLDAPFDLVILADLVGYLQDVQTALQSLHSLTHSHTRIVISLWNWMWQPILYLGERAGLKAPDLTVRSNWLSVQTVRNFLELAHYEVLQELPGLLLPYDLPPLSGFVNSLSGAPLFHRLALVHTVIARPVRREVVRSYTVSVIVPTRNEAGNIQTVVELMPEMGSDTEIIFIDGNSTDGTVEKVHEIIASHPQRDIKFMPQVPPASAEASTPSNLMLKLGKGDAVRKAFDAASGDILMILDSDISVRPDELIRFYDALASGQARFASGTRFAYPQERTAMPPLNRLGNVFFSLAFSWLLDQPITDTLCGTKALFKSDYELIKANRTYFGDFDPFGDFDLLFGAAWLKLHIIEIPIHYQARTYGESKVRVHIHGPLLGKMSLIALWQFKIRPLLSGRHSPAGNGEASPARVTIAGWLLFSVLISTLFWLLYWSFNKLRRG